MKKQVEFSKLLDLGKEDVANLSVNEQSQLVGGVSPIVPETKLTCTCGGGTTGTVTLNCPPATEVGCATVTKQATCICIE